jgi:hypothetical protein
MSRSGQGAGRPPLASVAAGSSRPAAQPGDSGFDARAALGLVGLGVVGHVLRSRSFYEKVAVAVIVLGALKRIGQDNGASAMESLRAWNKREIQRLERKAQRQGRAVKSSARMARSRATKDLAGAGPKK